MRVRVALGCGLPNLCTFLPYPGHYAGHPCLFRHRLGSAKALRASPSNLMVLLCPGARAQLATSFPVTLSHMKVFFPWPPSCCLYQPTPFVVSDERRFWHLNFAFGSSRIASSASYGSTELTLFVQVSSRHGPWGLQPLFHRPTCVGD
jgi:hypothetical protein